MKALVLSDPAEPPRLETDGPEPDVDGGTEAVRVVAAALNPVDLIQASSSESADLPRTVGNEAIVEYKGGLAYTERTVAPFGSIAERAAVRSSNLIPVPNDISPSAAVSLGIPAIAAWMSLTHVGRLAENETVLVLGATGAAGRIAVQAAAKLLSAGRVIAAGRNRESLQPLLEFGADEIAVLGTDDDTSVLRNAAGGDIDLVFDPLFGAPLVAAISALAPKGRSVTIGMSAGATAELSFPALMGKNILTYSNMTAADQLKAAAYRQLVDHMAAGDLVTRSEDVALDRAEDAWARQLRGPGTKLVIRP